jgi:hypothetical protein
MPQACGISGALQFLLHRGDFLLTRDLKFISDDQYEILNFAVTEVKRMLASLIVKSSTNGSRREC